MSDTTVLPQGAGYGVGMASSSVDLLRRHTDFMVAPTEQLLVRLLLNMNELCLTHPFSRHRVVFQRVHVMYNGYPSSIHRVLS